MFQLISYAHANATDSAHKVYGMYQFTYTYSHIYISDHTGAWIQYSTWKCQCDVYIYIYNTSLSNLFELKIAFPLTNTYLEVDNLRFRSLIFQQRMVTFLLPGAFPRGRPMVG